MTVQKKKLENNEPACLNRDGNVRAQKGNREIHLRQHLALGHKSVDISFKGKKSQKAIGMQLFPTNPKIELFKFSNCHMLSKP